MMRALPVSAWPEADRRAWEAACRPGARLKRGGRASYLKAISRADLERRSGYFLHHLASAGELDLSAPASTNITPEAVGAYLERVRPLWRSVTLAQSVYKLRRMAEILAPDADFAWLVAIEQDLAFVAQPQARFDRTVTTEVLVEAGLTLVREAEHATHQRAIWRAAQGRNGLMVALMALHPIRLKNFAALELGTSLVRIADDWWIVLSAADTKAGRPDERQLDPALTQALALYLTWARPVLLKTKDVVIGSEPGEPLRAGVARAEDLLSGSLWVGGMGEALRYGTVERILTETTRQTLGVAVAPHDFRRCGATTAALRAGAHPHLASALLQHRDRRVTDEHYNRASTLSAAGAFGRLIQEMRSTPG